MKYFYKAVLYNLLTVAQLGGCFLISSLWGIMYSEKASLTTLFIMGVLVAICFVVTVAPPMWKPLKEEEEK